MRWQRAAVPLGTAIALLYIDLQFALVVARFDIIAQATALELGVFGLQIVKTFAALALKRVRRASLGFLVDFYGAELLVLPFPALYYFLTHAAWAVNAITQVITGWMVGAAFATIPFVAYRISRAMLRSEDLMAVLPTGVIAAEVGVLFAGVGGTLGKGGLGGLLGGALGGRVGTTISIRLPVYAATTVVIFCLLVYALLDRGELPSGTVNQAIAIGIAGTLICAGWILGLGPSAPSLLVLLVTPTVCIAAISWWIGRAG